MFKAFLILAMATSLVLLQLTYKIGYNQPKVVSNAHIIDIYEKLAANSGQQDIPPLIILDSPEVNAWTNGTTVNFTTGILAVMENDDEIALVLAHEMAHAINHDPERVDQEVTPNNTEAHADKMGAYIMMRAGFDECKGKEIFKVFKKLFGDTADPVGHPDFAYRYDQLDLPMCDRASFSPYFS